MTVCMELTLIHIIYFERDAIRSLLQMKFEKEIVYMFVLRNL